MDKDIVGIGGELSTEILLHAYTNGIFPWYDESSPILWWSPDPRCVLPLDAVHIPRRLLRKWRTVEYEFTQNLAFREVMQFCARVKRPKQGGTWILPEMIDAYTKLHSLGYARSVEVWQDKELIAGIYGVCIGHAFFGESMFTLRPDASKLALLYLIKILKQENCLLFDCQQHTEHMARFGAIELPRKVFLSQLKHALELDN